jgi:hypothetical protein
MGNGGVELGHTPFLAEDSRLTDADHVVATTAHAYLVMTDQFARAHPARGSTRIKVAEEPSDNDG